MAKGEAGEEEAAPPSPLQGDLLEEILRRLPAVDLVPALYVSTAWCRAVYGSLRSSPRPKPWLFLHVQSRRNPTAVTTHAYDPHARSWARLERQSSVSSTLRSSSGSGLLFQLTPARLAVCAGGLGAAWRDLGSPRAWRTDPVVAAVGGHVVVAGGTCGLLDDPCSVEVHAPGDSCEFLPCDPLPGAFRGSASSTWLSAAASDRKMYVMEKTTGLICSLDVETKQWGPTAELRPDPSVFFSVVAFSGGRLILAGLGQDAGGDPAATSLRLWEANCESLECRLISGMPAEMLERLGNAGGSPLTSVDLCVAGDHAYVHNPSEQTLIASCDFAGGEWKWEGVKAPDGFVGVPVERSVLTCAVVGIDDLRAAFGAAVGGSVRRHGRCG